MSDFQFAISGYRILNLIHEAGNISSFRALREKDGKNVIIKTYRPYPGHPSDWDRSKLEYEILHKLKNTEGAIKALGIETSGEYASLFLEDAGGEPLKSILDRSRKTGLSIFPLADFLEIAVKISRILGNIHTRHILHKDINPTNIIYNESNNDVKITGFHISSIFIKEQPVYQNPYNIEGALAYISPEQTGRIDRMIDYRSDLYSLGIIFYELLTGRLPFESEDPLALIHAQIAKIPQTVSSVNPAVPPILSDIIMKLLAKNPEDRYQSAYGLEADLKLCQNALIGRSDLQDLSELRFILGKEDHIEQFRIPQKLYGRIEEVTVLIDSFKQASAGSQELVLIAGHAGVGKSALAAEIKKPVSEKGGYFISGKFDQYQQNRPYAAFSRAFEHFVNLLLTESDNTLSQWRKIIIDAVGSNGAVLTELIPGIEKIIGKQLPVTRLGAPENLNRFNLTFKNFMQAICTPEHVLVLSIDDLQWADVASLELLKALFTGEGIKHLFIIGTYRDNDLDENHPLMMTIKKLNAAEIIIKNIKLDNLHFNDMETLIRESLPDSSIDIELLSKLVYEKTQGNAFFMKQFLQNLYEENWLKFDPETGRWLWDMTELNTRHITDNVLTLIDEKIKKLSPESAKIIQIAACIGIEFNLRTLAFISQSDTRTILQHLKQSIDLGLIAPLNVPGELKETADAASFTFLHDRIQQASYTQISPGERQAAHLNIARALFMDTSGSDPDQMLFSTVQHYNKAGSILSEESEKARVADLNIKAADIAYRSAAFGSAQNYLETAMKLMPSNAWSDKYDIMLKLHSDLAIILSLTGDREQLERIFRITEEHARAIIDTAQIKMAKIQSLLYHGNYSESIDLGISFVRDMGIPINRNPSAEEALRYLRETADQLDPDRIQMLRHLPEAPGNISSILELTIFINGATFNSNINLHILCVSIETRLCIEHGLTPWAPVTLMTFTSLACAFLNDIPKSRLLAETIMQLFKERYYIASSVSPISLLMGGFILHRYDHLKHTLPILADGVHKGLMSGMFQFAAYCTWWQAWHHLFSGETLSKTEAICQKAEETCQKIQMGRFRDWCLLIHQVIHNLQGKNEKPWIIKGFLYNEEEKLALAFRLNDFVDVFRIFFYKGWLNYLFGRPQAALEFFEDAEKYTSYASGQYFLPLFYFYDTLANASLAGSKGTEERSRNLERINSNLVKFEIWARFAPMNHQHKKELMEAERARLENRLWEAASLYEKSINGARDNKFIQEEALACERAAEFYLANGFKQIARFYITKAHGCYSRWQAFAKVHDLENRYSQWLLKTSGFNDAANEYPGALPNLDIKSVMKASQAISGQIILEDLLEQLMEIIIENAGAQRGCLILERQGKWVIEAEGIADFKDIITRQAIDIDEGNVVCSSIIRYAARTHETITLADASKKELFLDDPYVKQKQIKSILCMPLLNRGRLSGIIYLENNLSTDAFSPKRIALLELLAGQAGIALENAELFERAQLEISDRKLAETALRESEKRFRTIFDSVNDAIFVHDPATGAILDVNRKMTEMFGYTREEAINLSIGDLCSGETHYTRQDAMNRVSQAVKEGPQIFDWRTKDKNGRIFWIGVNMRIAYIGSQDRLIVASRDINIRKQAEQELQEKTKELDLYFTSSLDMLCIADTDGYFHRLNPEWEKTLGYKIEELVGRQFLELVHPDDIESTISAVTRLKVQEQVLNFENRYRCKDGSYRWIEWRSYPSGKMIYAVARDITERKISEESLRTSEIRYKTLIESQDDLVSRYRPDTILTFVNDAYCQFFGKTREELIGQSYMFMVAPEFREQVRNDTEKMVMNNANVVGEYLNYRHDGKECWIQWAVRCIADETGKVIELQAVGRDISERKRIEEALEKRILALTRPLDSTEEISFNDLFNLADMQHLQDLFAEAFGVASLITNPDGTPITKPSNFSYFCSEIIRKTKKGAENCVRSDEIVGRLNLSGPTVQKCLSAGLCNAGAAITVGGRHVANWLIGQVRNEYIDENKIIRYADEIGADISFFLNAYYKIPVMSQEQFEKVAQVLFSLAQQLSLSAYQNVQQARFIADRKRAEAELEKYREHLEELVRERTRDLNSAQEELIRKERLAVLGQLTATVSHELRNPLGVIRSSAFYLKEKIINNDEKIKKHINRIEQQVDLCNSIVEELLEYTRGRSTEIIKGDFKLWLRDFINDLQMPQEIVITKNLTAELPNIHFDPRKMNRVITNLFGNAIYAVHEKSKKFELNDDTYKPEIRISAKPAGDGVEVIIEDNGIGMDEATAKTAFEPLFTTKARGTGLGLAIVRKIIEEHGGTVKLDSMHHKGTKVSIWLPAGRKN